MFTNQLTGAGINGRDQLTQDSLAWKPQIWLSDLYTLGRYPLCTRVCTERADDMFHAGIHLSASGVSENQVDDLDKWLEERSIPSCSRDAVVNGEFFGAGFEILLVDDGRPMEAPVDRENIANILAIVPAQRFEMTPVEWDTAILDRTSTGTRVNKNYGRPALYAYHPWLNGPTLYGSSGSWVPNQDKLASLSGQEPWKAASPEIVKRGMRIHASRVCHYPGLVLPPILSRDNGGYTDPSLRASLESIVAWYSHVYDAMEAGRHLAELVYKTDKLTQALDFPSNLVVSSEQARQNIQRTVAAAQLTASNRGVRMIEPQETLEYLGKALSGFDQLTQVLMTAVAVDSDYVLEKLFNIAPPGGIGAAGAGRFLWDAYEAKVKKRARVHLFPQMRTKYEYALAASTGPVRKPIPFQLDLGPLQRETPPERASRKLAEYQALELAQNDGWIDPREVRAREKSSGDGFIALDDKYDAELEGRDKIPLPDGRNALDDILGTSDPLAALLSGKPDNLSRILDPVDSPVDDLLRADADFKESDHPRASDGKFGSGGGKSGKPDKSGHVQLDLFGGTLTTSEGKEHKLSDDQKERVKALHDEIVKEAAEPAPTEQLTHSAYQINWRNVNDSKALRSLLKAQPETILQELFRRARDWDSVPTRKADIIEKLIKHNEEDPLSHPSNMARSLEDLHSDRTMRPETDYSKYLGIDRSVGHIGFYGQNEILRDPSGNPDTVIVAPASGCLSAMGQKRIGDRHPINEPGALMRLAESLKGPPSKILRTDENDPGLSDMPSSWSGIEVHLTHRQGEPRFGALLPCHYGDIPGTLAPDGQPVDCFCGPCPDVPNAFVISQVDPDTGAFDELKIMLGFASIGTAVATYLEAVDLPARFGGAEMVPAADLLAWLKEREP